MKNPITGNLFLLGMVLVLSFVSSAGADPTPLPNNRHIFINVANDAGVKFDIDGPRYGGPGNTYYIKADGGGLNSEWIGSTAADVTKGAFTVPTATPAVSGTLYFNDAGGRGFSDDIILLLSMKGPIPDNFSVHITSSGYTWTPATPGVYNPLKPTTDATGALGTATSPLADGSLNGLPIQPVGMVYQPVAVDETFTKADVIYGPHTAKPGPGTLGVWSLPLYPGQLVSDPSTAEYLMFVDLKAGAMRDATLVDNGSVRVDYSFTNLYGEVSFNMYGWVSAANQGQGISFTNPSTTNGYTVSYTGPPPPVTVPLTVTVAGTGGGTVNSTPSGIACSGPSCSASFDQGAQVTLLALPDSTSTFAGWSGDCTGGSCTVTMDLARAVTATFTAAPRVKAGSATYPTLQEAFDTATATMLSLGVPFSENPVYNRPGIFLQLLGGYDAGYMTAGGVTTINGSFTIGTGSLAVSNVVIR